MPSLRITIVQASLAWHDRDANLARFGEMLAGAPQTDLVVLPEMFTTGFSMDAPLLAERMDGPSVAWLRQQAAALGATVCGSLIIEADGHYFNRFVAANAAGNLTCYDKRHLFRLADEQHHYSAGTELVVFDAAAARICPLVCYDLRFPVWSRNTGNYDVLLYVANWPSRRHHAWVSLLRARAIENQCFVAGVNRVGADGNGIPYAGGSAIIDYLGDDLAAAGDREGLATAVLNLDRLRAFREKFPFHLDSDRFRIIGAPD